MNISYIDYKQTGSFSKLIIDYLDRSPELQPFYRHYPDIEQFSRLIEERRNYPIDRKILTDVLKRQYASLKDTRDHSVIDLLANENTFTVTTGHQLNIFTGPLYFIYKIISTINLAKQLSNANQGINVIPVYWMATEDHDIEEISYIQVFGNELTWETTEKGAAGRLDPYSLKDVIDRISEILGKSDEASKYINLFRKAYLEHSTLADATRYLVNELFGKDNLVIIDGDDPQLKSCFKQIIREDITGQHSFQEVSKTADLLAANYNIQVKPREINFFYLDKQLRERIVKENGLYKVLNTTYSWTEAELLSLIESSPELFSPNVITRGLYQECILPNLAYIGGGAEIAYWMELKSLFDHYRLSFPALILRNSALIIDEQSAKRLAKFGFDLSSIFKNGDTLVKEYLEKKEQQPDFTGTAAELSALFSVIAAETEKIDPTLKSTVLAEQQKALQSIEMINARIKKALKKKHEIEVQQLLKLKAKLFPGNELQERKENFFGYAVNLPLLQEELKSALDPLDFRFTILQ